MVDREVKHAFLASGLGGGHVRLLVFRLLACTCLLSGPARMIAPLSFVPMQYIDHSTDQLLLVSFVLCDLVHLHLHDDTREPAAVYAIKFSSAAHKEGQHPMKQQLSYLPF